MSETYSTEQAFLDAESERAAHIETLRVKAENRIAEAEVKVAEADGIVAELMADQVYDVEYAEGVGHDVREHLRIAAFHLRSALALAESVTR